MKPNKKQVEEEVKKLKELKPLVIPRSFFGDSNIDAIQAQIDTLEMEWDEDKIYNRFGDGERDMHVRNAALSALEWKNTGKTEDGDELSPSDGWKDLVKKKGE